MTSPDNIGLWTRVNAEWTDAKAAEAWADDEIRWGNWGIPEAELDVLGDVAGLDVVELGCGTAYFAAWLARRGARVVGVDPTPAQLETARRMQLETGLEFPLVEAFGEDVPLPDASFDLVVSEHGAATWADPFRWIPEASRLLRPEGRLVFMHSTPLAMVCSPDSGDVGTELQRAYFGMHRFEEPDGSVEFQLAHGDWIEVLRGNCFEVDRLLEVQAPAGAARHGYYGVDPEWGRKWPAEEIWVARRRPS